MPETPAKARILLVEDDAWLPVSIADVLGDRYETRVARNAAEARALAREWPADLVLCDVVLPDGDGVSLCRELKAEPSASAPVVVLLTGLACRETMVEGWKAGADDYLLKPFYPQELVARLRGLLAAREMRRQVQELDTLRARERFQRDFIANISHELRTPIAAIKGFAETLSKRGAGERERRLFSRRIEHQADRLARMVDDVLTLACVEARGEDGWTDLDLSALASDFVERLRPSAERRRVSLAPSLDADLPVRGDRDQLCRVLETLLEHAIAISPKHSTVQVSLARDGPSAVASVRDEGPPISPEHLDCVFDYFFRAARSSGRGTGLGLSIVRRVAEAHGGRVWASSDRVRGATLSLSLPLKPEKAAAQTDA